MLTAIGWALLAAVEPLGVVAFIALLGSREGRRNTLGFIVGWVLCAGVVAVLTVLVASGRQRSAEVSQVVGSAGVLQIAVGLLALILLVVRRRRRLALAEPGPGQVGTPEEERAVGPLGAAVIGAMVQGWPVVAAAVGAVLQATDAVAGRVLGIGLVILVSASTYLAAHILAGLHPESTAHRLELLRRRIETHRDLVIDLLLLGGGAWLVGHGLVVQLTT